MRLEGCRSQPLQKGVVAARKYRPSTGMVSVLRLPQRVGSEAQNALDLMTGPSSTKQTEECRLAELMVAYQAGDLNAFKQLYAILAEEARRYFARIHRDRGVIHDLVQDLFLEIHRSRRTYAPPLPVRPWIFGIARNVAARSRRAARLQPNESLEQNTENELAGMPAADLPPGESLDIENALTALPASTREPWLLHHLFGFSFDSIAERLGITVMAAKLRSSRATRALRLALRATGKPSP
jgi:RNA polymerase sigma-70 factor (ECF subfamily)